jgi:hypothetical protein
MCNESRVERRNPALRTKRSCLETIRSSHYMRRKTPITLPSNMVGLKSTARTRMGAI